MGKERAIVAIDIGTSKTTVLVGDIDNIDDLYIVGHGESKTRGIEKGIIVKSQDVVRSIKEAIDMAESTTGSKISSAVINIGGYNLECLNIEEEIEFDHPKTINKSDTNELLYKITSKVQNEDYEIIHVLPKKYVLDEEYEVIDPAGLFGSKLRGKFHIVLAKTNTYMNLKKVVEAAGIRVADVIANPVASANAVLYAEEEEMGVAVLDIGAGTTDLAVYNEGSIEYIKAFPVAGNHITMDIAHRFKLSKEEAEELKKAYGTALVDQTEETIIELHSRGNDEPILINSLELADTIEARLSEIYELVKNELEEMGFLNKINGGIVLTGGVANTIFAKELAERVFNKDVRIGKPKDFKGSAERIAYPEYATSIGMLLFKKSKFEGNVNLKVDQVKAQSIFEVINELLGKLKKLF